MYFIIEVFSTYFIEKYVLENIFIILMICVYLDSGGLGLGRVE